MLVSHNVGNSGSMVMPSGLCGQWYVSVCIICQIAVKLGWHCGLCTLQTCSLPVAWN